MGVINPLHEIQRKLIRVQEVLDNISDSSVLTVEDLKAKIQGVLDD